MSLKTYDRVNREYKTKIATYYEGIDLYYKCINHLELVLFKKLIFCWWNDMQLLGKCLIHFLLYKYITTKYY